MSSSDSAPNAHDYNAIRNVISLYCIALDTKDWPLLDKVFVKEVVANYPFDNEPILGREALTKRIQERLTPVTTQHALTTQHLILSSYDSHSTSRFAEVLSAKATTYFTGVHIGKGKWQGQQVIAYGKYHDQLVCVQGRGEGEGDKPEAGASGQWMISERTVTFFGRVGEEGVMRGEE